MFSLESQKTDRNYRRDIEGLRAIAVISVFIFHLSESYLPGGFVGVDVFYVISGFVIFRLIINKQLHGNFSIAEFYKNRLRRIFPALVATIVFCLLLGFFILTPREYESLSFDALAAIFSVSNIHYADRLDYFADAANSIALLHTWSLGVEEQFYLLAPLTVLAFMRFSGLKGIFYGLISIFVLSFLCNLFMIYQLNFDEKAFYWPISRFWEIAAGGLVACVESRVRFGHRTSTILGTTGLLGIVASTAIINTSMAFPAFAALLPVLSTAVFILAGLPAESAVFRIISSGVVRFFGKISYSLYLLHWPVIVFAGLYLGRTLTIYENTLLFLATTLLAAASWKFVENPFRRGGAAFEWRKARFALAGSGLSACVIAAVTMSQHGFPLRMQTQTPEGSKNLQTRLDRDLCAPVPALNSVAKATGCSYSGLSGGADYLIWGDSHAAMITPQLSEALERRGMHGAVATMAACPPLIDVYTSKRKNRKECSELADQIVGFVTENRVDTVILASRWAGLASPVRAPGNGSLSKELFSRSRNGQPITFQDAIQETANALKAAGADVVIVGPVPEINFHVPDMVMRSRHLGHDLPHPDRKDFDLRQSIILEAMKDVGKTPWVTVVYPHKFLCDARYCRIAKGSVPLYRDDDHLSRAGVGLILDGIVTAVMPSEPSKDRCSSPSQALQPKACLRQSPALQAGAPGDPD